MQFSDDIIYLEGTKALIRFSDQDGSVCDDVGKLQSISVAQTDASGDNQSYKIKAWGRNNRQPQDREDLVKGNNIVGELIKTKRDIILGSSLQPYRLVYENGKKRMEFVEMPPEAQEFFQRVDIEKYLLAAANNLVKHSNVFTEFIRAKNGQIYSIKCLEARHLRAGEQNNQGQIENYFWCGSWGYSRKESKSWPITRIPAYLGEEEQQAKFILHTGDDLLTDEYYYIPSWWGSRDWIELANAIPVFHKANLGHGYSIRYHVEVPKDYFSNNTTGQQSMENREQAKQARDAARKEFVDNLNKFLQGMENAGRTVITEYEINRAAGKEFSGIKIKPLDVNLQDEALLKLFDRSNQANISGQGIHPTLAAIESQGKLSSGSELRNALIVYTAIKTPNPRKILLKALDLVHQVNGWPADIKWTFSNIEVTTLDENPTATQEVAVE